MTTIERYVVLPEQSAIAAALWVLHAHTHGAADISPFLALLSSEKRCGKTIMLQVVGTLSPRRVFASNITPAARVRKRPETVRRWIAAGKIESERAGAHVRIPAAALDPLKRTCEHCGKTYTPERPTRETRFCSDRCRWAANAERRKAKRPATRGPGRPRNTPQPGKLDPCNKRLATALKHTRKPTG